MGNALSKTNQLKGKKSRTKIIFRQKLVDKQNKTLGTGKEQKLSAWFSLPDVTDDIPEPKPRIRSNSFDRTLLQNLEKVRRPLVVNGIKKVEVKLPKISKPRPPQKTDILALSDPRYLEESEEDKEVVKIITLAKNNNKDADKNKLNNLEIVVNSPRENLLKQYLREIRISKQNISSITETMANSHEDTKIQSYVKERLMPNTIDDTNTYKGNLQESKRLQLSRSTPNLVEFDKPLTVRQDSAESLSSLVAANTLDTGFKPIEPPNPPKKFPRTFEYEKSSLQTSSRSSAFVSTKVRYRSRTETQPISSSDVHQAGRNQIVQRPVSLYQDPPRSEYHLRFQSQREENSNNSRPVSASTQQVKFRTEATTADLRRRRERVISYPNIKHGELVSTTKQEHDQVTNSPRLAARFSLPSDSKEIVQLRNQRNETALPKRRSSKEELNMWRSARENTERSRHNSQEQKMYSQENSKISPSLHVNHNHQAKQNTAYEALFTYNSQTYPYKNQQNVNGFYKDLELTPNYNSTGRPRKVSREQGLASPARSLSDRSTTSGTPRMERRYKTTSYEDGMTNGLYVPKSSRASKSPQMSRGSGSPHSSHSDPQEHEANCSRGSEAEVGAGRSIRLTNGIDSQNNIQNGSPIGAGQHHVSFQQDLVQHEKLNDHHMQPHAKLIQDNMDVLCEQIDLNESGLWEVLLAKGIITRRKCDRIKAKHPNETEQIRQVLHILGKCSGEDFKAFKAALEATGQSHIVENLLLSKVGNRAIDRWRIALARYYLEEAQLDELPLYPLDNSWQTGDIIKYYTRTTFADVTGRGRFFDERHFDAYSQLFVDRGVVLRRLAVVGDAGCGKSTLARKITLDWSHHVLAAYLHPDKPSKKSRDARGGEEEGCLHLFQLLVYVDLENIPTNATVRDLLLQRINHKDESDCSGIDSFLRDHQRECLLIFDGWDSFQPKTAPAMGLIAQGRAMQNTPVLFTYRPDCESIPTAVERTFEIRGFDEEQAREYIVKLLYSQGEQSSINKLTGFISKKKLWKRCSSPEYLNLLCFTFCHGKKEKGRSSWKIDI